MRLPRTLNPRRAPVYRFTGLPACRLAGSPVRRRLSSARPLRRRALLVEAGTTGRMPVVHGVHSCTRPSIAQQRRHAAQLAYPAVGRLELDLGAHVQCEFDQLFDGVHRDGFLPAHGAFFGRALAEVSAVLAAPAGQRESGLKDEDVGAAPNYPRMEPYLSPTISKRLESAPSPRRAAHARRKRPLQPLSG